MAVAGQRRSSPRSGRRAVRARLLSASAVAAVAVLALAGCGSNANSGSGSTITELDYYSDAQGSAAWNQVLSTCEKQTGITVKRQAVPTSQLLPRILQDGPHNLPDLAFVDNPTLQQIADTGALTPLSDYGFAASGYFPSIVQAGTYHGQLYGLAPGVNGLALMYNKDMLAAAGLRPPTTWAELQTDAGKLTQGTRYGLAFSAVATEEGTWQFLPFFWSNGGDLSTLDSARGVQALQYVSGLVSDGSVSKSVLTWNQNDVADQFVAGNAAMMINGSWTLPQLDSTANLHYGVVSIPVPQAGMKPVIALGGEVGVIPATGTDTQKAAAKVLNCVLSGNTMAGWDKGHDYVPSKTDVATTFGRQNPEMRTFVTEVASARSRTAQLGAKYAKVSTALGSALQAALTGTQSPQAALATAQQQAGGS